MSKYAALPDIDTAPDVYETEDVPPVAGRRGELDDSDDDLPGSGAGPSMQRSGSTTGLNDAIDESGLPSFDQAGRKFGALAAMTYTLYPSMTTRSDPTLASASLPSDGGTYDSPIVEHPRARLRRLRYEMEELEQFLSKAPEPGDPAQSAPGDKEAEEAHKTARMMEELKGLQSGLRSLDVKAGRPQERRDGWEASLKKLKDNRSRPMAPSQQAETFSSNTETEAAATGRVADLDQRLATLETVLGTHLLCAEDPSDPPAPVLPTLAKMDHLMTMLTQPRHLDAISRRIKLLLTDLDRAHASTKSAGVKRQSLDGDSGAGLGSLSPSHGGGQSSAPRSSGTLAEETVLTSAQAQKLDQVLGLVPRLQPLLPLLPHLLARLRSLSELHESAATFDETLKQLEQSSARLTSAQQETKTVVDRLDGSIRTNEEMIEANFRALGGRVGDIRRRLAALDGGETAES